MTTALDFGATGDGKTDDTEALLHALGENDGRLILPRGDYRITRPLAIPLDRLGRLTINGTGGTARLLMDGAGPALHLIGTHTRTADPTGFAEGVWLKERMPMVQDLEIVGRHPEADGIRIEGVMQPTLQGVQVRQCRHGIHLFKRARNVLITACHVYDNRGVGVFLDQVNLHQIVITGNHISYCKRGGLVVAGSEVRNIQICGNDIEYNYDEQADTSADVLFDCRKGTVREGTLVGNTIQAKRSPAGANVRLVGVGRDDPNAVGLLAITGNLIGSQATALHLVACRGVVVSGNSIYSGYDHALVAEDAVQLVVAGNSIDHNPEYKGASTDQVRFERCRDVNVTGLLVQHTLPAEKPVEASVWVQDCANISFTGCQVVNARTRGLWVKASKTVRVADCTLQGRPGDADYLAPLEVDAGSSQVMVTNNFLGRGSAGEFRLHQGAGQASGNLQT